MAVKAVFLDRDDTITLDPGYVASPDSIKLAPGAAAAMKTLRDAGYVLVCVTNQSGIARGMFSEEQLAAVHQHLRDMLALENASLDAIYYCPFHPEGTLPQYTKVSDDRKPGPGMLLKASADLDIDLAASWMVGDRPADVEAGKRAGCKTIRVLTGKFGQNEIKVRADFTAANMTEAARIILAQRPKSTAARTEIKHDPAPPPAPPPATPATPPAQNKDAGAKSPSGETETTTGECSVSATIRRNVSHSAPAQKAPAAASNNDLLQDIALQIRQMVRLRQHEDFSLTKLLAGLFEGLSLLSMVLGILGFLSVSDPSTQNSQFWKAMGWLAVAAVTQLTALSFYIMGRRE